MNIRDSEYLAAKKGLEDLLEKLDTERLYDVYTVQGYLGLTFALKVVEKSISTKVWSYIKQNKSDLRFHYTIPSDI